MLVSHVRGPAARLADEHPGIIGYSVVGAAVAVALGIYLANAQGLAADGNWFVTGQVLGICAAVLLAVAGILAVRLRPLEWLFGDTTKVYVAHGVIGLTMFGLVTVHPLLYVIGVLPSTTAGGQILIPFNQVILDWISYLLIALALLPTLWVRLRYDLWRFTHLLLGAAVVITMTSLLITSTGFDTYQILALRIYLFVLFGLSIAAILYAAVIRRFAEPKRVYQITHVEHFPQAQATELHLEATGAPLAYRAGQFTYVDLLDDELPARRDYESHPYSIASAPNGSSMTVIVQSVGTRTERIQHVEDSHGARALIHGAYGRLGSLRNGTSKQVWIGGGSGITPFLAMAEEFAASPAGRAEVTLVVGVDRIEEAFYLDRLQRYESQCPAFTVLPWVRERDGLPTGVALAKQIPDLAERVVLLSGPDEMVASLISGLCAAGVRRGRIHSELAIGPPRKWRHSPPALRVMRWIITAELLTFLGASIASAITQG